MNTKIVGIKKDYDIICNKVHVNNKKIYMQ